MVWRHVMRLAGLQAIMTIHQSSPLDPAQINMMFGCGLMLHACMQPPHIPCQNARTTHPTPRPSPAHPTLRPSPAGRLTSRYSNSSSSGRIGRFSGTTDVLCTSRGSALRISYASSSPL